MNVSLDKLISLDDNFNESLKEVYKTENEENIKNMFAYVYAIISSSAYANIYYEYMFADYTNIIFYNLEDVNSIASIGKKLIALHLLEDEDLTLNVEFLSNSQSSSNSQIVEQPLYLASEQKLYINQQTYFSNVPIEVYNYNVANKLVIEKYLLARKTRVLSLDEIQHVIKVIKSLHKSLTVEQELNDAIYKAEENHVN